MSNARWMAPMFNPEGVSQAGKSFFLWDLQGILEPEWIF
jgi:hypothetical protein